MPVSAHLVPGTGCQDYIISFGVRRRECFISVGTGDLAEDEKCIDTMYKCVKMCDTLIASIVAAVDIY